MGKDRKKIISEWINAAKGFKGNMKDTYYGGGQAKILERKYVH